MFVALLFYQIIKYCLAGKLFKILIGVCIMNSNELQRALDPYILLVFIESKKNDAIKTYQFGKLFVDHNYVYG